MQRSPWGTFDGTQTKYNIIKILAGVWGPAHAAAGLMPMLVWGP